MDCNYYVIYRNTCQILNAYDVPARDFLQYNLMISNDYSELSRQGILIQKSIAPLADKLSALPIKTIESLFREVDLVFEFRGYASLSSVVLTETEFRILKVTTQSPHFKIAEKDFYFQGFILQDYNFLLQKLREGNSVVT